MHRHLPDPTHLALGSGVTLDWAGGKTDPVTLAKGRRQRTATGPEAAMVSCLATGADEATVQDAFCSAGGDFIDAMRFLWELNALGLLDRIVAQDGLEIARLNLFSGAYDASLPATGDTIRLSRFALLRSVDGRMVAESPLGHGRVTLSGPALATLEMLAEGVQVGALAQAAALSDTHARAFAALLLNGRIVHQVDPSTGTTFDDHEHVALWEFHDLLFHSRSRLGRFDTPYGGTYHRKGVNPPPSFLSPPPDTPPIALPRPDMDALAREDPPFAFVMEARRSVRDYGAAKLSIADLGELLFRAARVSHRLETGDDDMDYSFRPHPGGGAIHELSIYPVIGDCEGLDRGIYQYDPEAHVLRPVPADPGDVDAMLEAAWITGDSKSRPQVYLAITARAERIQWKYQSMVYAVILKNVGALYQTFYLAATAMGLAPTALGGGDSDLFARATGRDYYAESLVGEFLIGARP